MAIDGFGICYISVKLHTIYICQFLLNEDIPNDDILIASFPPETFRADKPENIRNGGSYLYFKENLPVKERNDLETLPETIAVEIKINRK